MAKRKTDEQLQDEMNLHSRNVIETLQISQKVHRDAMILWMNDHQEDSKFLIKQIIQEQRFAIAESQKVIRLQKVLSKRQEKRMDKQKDDFDSNTN